MGSLEPDRLHAALAAVPGAVLYGTYHLVTLFLTGSQATTADYVKAIINAVCAIGAGAVLAYFMAQAASGWIPVASFRDPKLIGFLIGILGWELLPVAINAARGRIGKIGGGQ